MYILQKNGYYWHPHIFLLIKMIYCKTFIDVLIYNYVLYILYSIILFKKKKRKLRIFNADAYYSDEDPDDT